MYQSSRQRKHRGSNLITASSTQALPSRSSRKKFTYCSIKGFFQKKKPKNHSITVFSLSLLQPFFSTSSEFKEPKPHSFLSFENSATEGVASCCQPVAKRAVPFHPPILPWAYACSFPFPSLHWSHKWAVGVQSVRSCH